MKKKALIVANLAGFASFLISDIEILQSMGYEVVYAANTNMLPWEDTKKKLIELKVKIEKIDFDTKNPFSKSNIKAYKQLKEILKKEQFDLIHCHTPITGLLTRVAAIKYIKKGTKVIYTTHGFTFNKYSSKKSWLIYYNLEKFLSRFCNAIITINKEDYETAKRMHCKNVYYINGVGVDISKYNNVKIDIQKYKEKLGIDTNKIMILSVGELSSRKNHKIILEAISKLDNKSEYVYVICGNGIGQNISKELKAVANENNIDLQLLGFRFDIPEIIRCSDIGAIPSIREGLGLAGIQSLAGGIPVVASDVQGIKDYVKEGETGYLCNPFDAEDFAEGIIKLTDNKVRKEMESKCKEIASGFDISISIEQRKNIYKSL